MNSENIVVGKFGGSSVANATQIMKIEEIFNSDDRMKYIIVSAPKGITDKLYNLYYKNRGIEYSAESEYTYLQDSKIKIFTSIIETYAQISTDLGIDNSITKSYMIELERILQNKNHTIHDVLKTGEEHIAKIIALHSGAKYIDAKDAIHIDENNNPDNDTTNEWIRQTLTEDRRKIIVGGFYGNISIDRKNPIIKTLGRGAGDLSGAIFAAMLDSDYYNYTDQNGILCFDPRIIENLEERSHIPIIDDLTYEKTREFAWFGAKVLNEETIAPLEKRGNKTFVRNTNNPLHQGTIITPEYKLNLPVIGITGRERLCKIDLEKDVLINGNGTESELITGIEKFFLSRDIKQYNILSWGNSTSILVDQERFMPYEKEVITGIEQTLNKPIIIEKNKAIIAIIGSRGINNINTAYKTLEVLNKNNVEAEINKGGRLSEDIILVINNNEYKKISIDLYNTLLRPKKSN
jgi:aspartate kinase